MSIPRLCQELQRLFTKEAMRLAKEAGLRERQWNGASLARLLVFGWLAYPHAGISQLVAVARSMGIKTSKQALDAHFTERTAAFLLSLLQQAVRVVVCGPTVPLPLLQRFRAVYIEDGSTIALPAALASLWRGCGGNPEGKQAASYQGIPRASSHPKTEAGIKLTVRWDLVRGSLHGPHLQAGRHHELSSVLRQERMEAGSLWVADLGYFALVVLGQLAKEGVFFLQRYKEGVVLWRGNQRIEVLDVLPQTEEELVDVQVACGARKQVKARLLAQRVPQQVAEQRRLHLKERARKQQQPVSPRTWELCQWTILLTNVPATQLSIREAVALIRARWQIELLFKLWKSQGLVDEWSSQKPWQVLCEVYAKLLALVVQHWLLIQGCWDDPHHSLVQAAAIVRDHSPLFREALGGHFSVRRVVQAVVRALQTGCSIPPRPRRPSTSRLLEGEPFWGLT